MTGGERPAEPGETCECGRPAAVVYLTEQFGEVPACGRIDVPPDEPADGGSDR